MLLVNHHHIPGRKPASLERGGVSAGSGAQRAVLTSGGDESQEFIMSTSTPLRAPAINFASVNWVASAPLPRDQTQSHRLHEPEHRIDTIDPMTGNDIEDVTNHPFLEDGNLTIYFETKQTRKAYLDLPINHPNRCLPFPATDEDDRGG